MIRILDNFKPEGGSHCITNSLKQVFRFHGFDFTEEMLFGLASGLNFFYFEFKFSPVPLIGGRTKIGEFEENLARILNIKIDIHETISTKKAFETLKMQIENGSPAMIYADMAYLKYLMLPEEYHFGGHSVVVFGIDEEKGTAYISDRDDTDFKVTINENEQPKSFHIVPLEELAKARGSKEKPYPPKNRLLTFDFSNFSIPVRSTVCDSILMNCSQMLNPPIKNLGISGIKLFAEKLEEWSRWDEEKLKSSAFNCFIMINKTGGTGGGCFRNMYGHFLVESGRRFSDDFLVAAGKEYIKVAGEWDLLADYLLDIYKSGDIELLPEIQKKLEIIYIQEEELMRRLEESIC